ncbi:MAG TPA: hypothetical protein VJI68_02860 [Candidatus Nanoarchaeia archaeon]|nr:hypothetical protein [Candidatus Nanoarchaeia archaeon]
MGQEIRNVADIVGKEIERNGLWRESFLIIEHNQKTAVAYVDRVTAKIQGKTDFVATLYRDRTIIFEETSKNNVDYVNSLRREGYQLRSRREL